MHQLLYLVVKKNYIKNSLFANNTSSLIINIVNLAIIYVSSMNPYSSIYQITLIIISLIIYTAVFTLLKNKMKNHEY